VLQHPQLLLQLPQRRALRGILAAGQAATGGAARHQARLAGEVPVRGGSPGGAGQRASGGRGHLLDGQQAGAGEDAG
jgi:hypothetical protein